MMAAEPKDVVLGELHAQVARLKAANKAKDAALGDLEQRATSLIADKSWAGYSRLRAMAQVARAALLDTAGEGWLPPEMREQAAKELVRAKEFCHRRTFHTQLWKDCRSSVCRKVRAALDALGVK